MIAAVISSALEPSFAWAQTPREIAAARSHFKAARQLEDAKNWEGASAELRAAVAIKETPGLRYHLAYCQEQLAHYAAALRNYQRAQQLLGEGQQAADVSQLLGPAIERVRALVGELTLISPDGGAYQVFLDGNEVELGKPTIVDPGLHKVRAVRDGEEQRHEVSVAARAKQRLELDVPSAPEGPAPAQATPSNTPPAPPATAAEQSSLKAPVLIGEGVVTLLGLGLGIGFTLQANKASSEADEALADINAKDPQRQCSSDKASVQSACAQLQDFKQQEFDARDLATIGFVTAGVGAVSLITTWLLWPAPQSSSARSVGIRIQTGASTGSVELFGSF